MPLKTFSFDERRHVTIPGDRDETILFATHHLIEAGKDAINQRGRFVVALSGGSTPKALFKELKKHKNALDWNLVFVFWSDERAVPPDHPDSNYKMAMENGIESLAIPKHQIFRMQAEVDTEAHAATYEAYIRELLPDLSFDLIMLGMGDDGHTASLFPKTKALKITDKLVVDNYVEQKKTHRMTFTYPLIQKARQTVFYVMGEEKKEMVVDVFYDKNGLYPSSLVGSQEHPSLWILDELAASSLMKKRAAA